MKLSPEAINAQLTAVAQSLQGGTLCLYAKNTLLAELQMAFDTTKNGEIPIIALPTLAVASGKANKFEVLFPSGEVYCTGSIPTELDVRPQDIKKGASVSVQKFVLKGA